MTKRQVVERNQKWFMSNCKWNPCGWISVQRHLGGLDKGVSLAFEEKKWSVGVCEYFNHDSFSRIFNAPCFNCPCSLGLYLQHDGWLHALLNNIFFFIAESLESRRDSQRSSLKFPSLTWVWFVIILMLLWPLLFWRHVVSWLLYCSWEICSHIKS